MSGLLQSSQDFIELNRVAEFTCSEPWLNKLRRRGLKSFSTNGLPTPNIEEWKYTNLKVLDDFGNGNGSALDVNQTHVNWLPAGLEAHKLVFVNGRFDKDLSAIGKLGKGIRILSLSEALVVEPALIKNYLGQISSVEDFPFLSLNTAFIEDGLVVLIENAEVVKPIEVSFVSCGGGNTHHPRSLIVAKDRAQVTILERHVGVGEGAYFANSVFEVLVDGGSHVKHYRVLEDSAEGVNLSSVKARVGVDGTYESFILSVGGCLSRSEIHVACQAEGAHTNLSGVYIGRADQHMDHTTSIEHLVPYTSSNESYKGVLDDRACGVFQGSVVVSEGADGTDARMSNKTLLLSDGAEIDAKPQLEIYADDVQCAHGFTAGELDEDALFYLRSRGIPDTIARSMLIEGFLIEVIDSGVDKDYQSIFRAVISGWKER